MTIIKLQQIEKEELFKQGLKQCSKCPEPKELSEFSKLGRAKDGLQYLCKEHYNKQSKEYQDKPENKEKRKQYRDKPEVKAKKKEYNDRSENKEMMAKSYQKNKEKRNEYQKAYNSRKRKTNLSFRILTNLRTRLCHALKGHSKSKRTLDLLGCSIEELKTYLKKQFTKGMSWDNYGLWHIDHKIPCANFDMSDERNQNVCFNYTNLQPLWAIDNHSKAKKLVIEES